MVCYYYFNNNEATNENQMFKVTIESFNNTVIETQSFNTKKEANVFKRQAIKLNGMIKHAHHVVNYSKGLELFTNY